MMHPVDGLVVLVPLLVLLAVATRTRRHVRSVADFLAAGRCAGRYLLSNARGEATFGAISAVALFEMIYKAGFAITWWQMLQSPVVIVLGLLGYVVYRFRETRAMTLAQFFEQRYSRRFRVFAGLLTFASGVINYGIFPAVGARFFVYYLGLPPTLALGACAVPTFAVLMALFLSFALLLVLAGGQLTIMVSDCLEGLFSLLAYLVIILALLWLFPWEHIVTALGSAPPGQSRLNPFDTAQAQDFNLGYVLIAMATTIYAYNSWQGNAGFNCAAATPHEAKMANILGGWRTFTRSLLMVLLAVCAYTYLHHPAYAAGAAQVQAALQPIGNPQLQEQLRVPVALGVLLPVGIKGLFCAVMVFAMLATDCSYLHSWGSIFVQDVVLPFRRTPLAPAQHLRLLRLAIVGVALFAFVFSLLFRQTEYIFMFFAITAAIYAGGAGAVILGGLYWRRGTTAGAWGAMSVGALLAVGGIALRQLDPQFPLNGQVLSFLAMMSALAVYVLLSLWTCRAPFDLDRLLHRGAYAVAADAPARPAATLKARWLALIGIDAAFTRGDKAISLGLFAWTCTWTLVFLGGTLWNLWRPWPLSWWARYWHVAAVLVPLLLSLGTVTWFTLGGVRDLRRLFARLDALPRDAADNGQLR